MRKHNNKFIKTGKEKNMKLTKLNLVILGCLSVLGYCGYSATKKEKILNSKSTYWPTTKWRTSSPEKQGMSSQKLLKLIEFGNTDEFIKYTGNKFDEIDSILIIRNGYVIVDANYYPYSPDKPHHVFSETKSIISILIGIAIDKGYIKDVNQSVIDFFPDLKIKNMSENKKALTVKDLLSMQGGFKETFSLSEAYKFGTSKSWLQFALDSPMYTKPGTEFYYCNTNTYLLSAIIQKTTGQTTVEFADKYLFKPLGITNYKCYSSPENIFLGFKGLDITPYDLAKIGYMYLHDGRWKNQQIVSRNWIDASTTFKTNTKNPSFGAYGYQWWLDPKYPELFIAYGASGQLMFINRKLNIIVVITGSIAMDTKPYALYKEFIIPSIISDKAIASDKTNYDKLIKTEQQIQSSRKFRNETNTVPKIMDKIVGKSYGIIDNKGKPIVFGTFIKENNEYYFVESINLVALKQKFKVIFLAPDDKNPAKSKNELNALLISDYFERRHFDLIFTDNEMKGEYLFGALKVSWKEISKK